MEKERACYVCRTKKPVTGLMRIARVKNPDGTFKFALDPKGTMGGRGCHICRCPDCVGRCLKTRALNRSFKTNVSNDLYEELSKSIAK